MTDIMTTLKQATLLKERNLRSGLEITVSVSPSSRRNWFLIQISLKKYEILEIKKMLILILLVCSYA